MKVAIIGSRSFNNYKLFVEEIKRVLEEKEWTLEEIVSGGAGGTDRLAWQYALVHKIKYTEFPADWKKFGKRAGHMRNTDIINYADVVIAFWDLRSPGTSDSIKKATEQGKSIVVINFTALGKNN